MPICKQRLFLSVCGTLLVTEDNPDAASLYAIPGDEIPESAVEKFGLVDGALPGFKPEVEEGGQKEKAPSQDKEKKGDADKDRKPADDKSGAGASAGSDDLTKVKFVGAASAAALAKAGLTTYAALAAIDPANPPSVEGMGVSVNWKGIQEAAVELAKQAA